MEGTEKDGASTLQLKDGKGEVLASLAMAMLACAAGCQRSLGITLV